jgi:hypothetical protein
MLVLKVRRDYKVRPEQPAQLARRVQPDQQAQLALLAQEL